MKKIYTLIVALMATVGAFAQDNTFQFCKADGTIVPSGSTVTASEYDPDQLEWDIYQINSGLFILNTSSVDEVAELAINVETLEGAELSCCLGTECRPYGNVGNYTISGQKLAAGKPNDMMLHAERLEEAESMNAKVKLTISHKSGFVTNECATITVIFQDGEAGVQSIQNGDVKVVKTFDAMGRETTAQKGLLIEQLSNGQVRKVIK